MDIYFGTVADEYYAKHPLTLVDVGARGGVQPNWRSARRHLRLVGFEPDPAECARLTALAAGTRDVYINAAVSASNGETALNIARDPGTSSVLAPNMAFLRRFPQPERFEIVQQVSVAAGTLDTLLAQHGVEDPDFVKVDVQGAELQILQGSLRALSDSIVGAEIEVQIAPLYVGQPTFGQIDDLMRAHGFQLFDLRPSYWKRAAGARFGGPKGQLVFADVLYLKTEAGLAAQLQSIAGGDARRSRLLHALSVSALYGYLDFAIGILAEHRGELPRELAEHIDIILRSDVAVSARLPHFRGRGWLSHLLYRLHRAFYPTVDRWASGGRTIGNVD